MKDERRLRCHPAPVDARTHPVLHPGSVAPVVLCLSHHFNASLYFCVPLFLRPILRSCLTGVFNIPHAWLHTHVVLAVAERDADQVCPSFEVGHFALCVCVKALRLFYLYP